MGLDISPPLVSRAVSAALAQVGGGTFKAQYAKSGRSVWDHGQGESRAKVSLRVRARVGSE